MKLTETTCFNIQINYKSGNVITGWFTMFEMTNNKYTWDMCGDPDVISIINNDYDTYTQDEYNKKINFNTPILLKIGVDEIESVVQLSVNTLFLYR